MSSSNHWCSGSFGVSFFGRGKRSSDSVYVKFTENIWSQHDVRDHAATMRPLQKAAFHFLEFDPEIMHSLPYKMSLTNKRNS